MRAVGNKKSVNSKCLIKSKVSSHYSEILNLSMLILYMGCNISLIKQQHELFSIDTRNFFIAILLEIYYIVRLSGNGIKKPVEHAA